MVIFAAEYAVTNWSLIIWKFIEKERELMDKFTVEEINLMCVQGAGQDGHDCRHTERDPPHTGQ